MTEVLPVVGQCVPSEILYIRSANILKRSGTYRQTPHSPSTIRTPYHSRSLIVLENWAPALYRYSW